MSSQKYDERVEILENGRINDKYYRLSFRSKHLSQNVHPGQFLQVLIQPSGDPFLRRPFSYYRISGERIEILYEILGRGTSMLAEKAKGAKLKVLGPLGCSFTLNVKKKKRVLF